MMERTGRAVSWPEGSQAPQNVDVMLDVDPNFASQQEARVNPPNVYDTQQFGAQQDAQQFGVQPDTQHFTPDLEDHFVVQPEEPSATQCHFVPGKAKEMIGTILREKLTGATYDPKTAPFWVREITDAIKAQLKGMDLNKYKLVVQAVLGEQRGQGFQMSCRCFWDPNTDNYAHESFTNDSIFCVAGAFALNMC